MNDIKITPTTQLVILAAIVAAIAVALGAQAPEFQRYLKIRSM